MKKKKVLNFIPTVEGVAPPVAHYSTAVRVENPTSWLFPSGILPLDKEGTLPKGIYAQASQVLENMEKILASQGFTFAHIVKINVALKTLDDFKAFGQVYEAFMGDDCPARAAYGQAGIALSAKVEIEVIAAK